MLDNNSLEIDFNFNNEFDTRFYEIIYNDFLHTKHYLWNGILLGLYRILLLLTILISLTTTSNTSLNNSKSFQTYSIPDPV